MIKLKNIWKIIENKVNSSIVLDSSEERKNVLDRLDYVIGENLIEKQYPYDYGNLSENERLYFKKMIDYLNQNLSEAISTERDYEKAVKEIIKTNPDKKTRTLMVKMDLAYQDENWKDVNKWYEKIKERL